MPPTKTKPKAPTKTPGYVYLINAKGTDRYKIGVTRRPINDRLAELQRQSPYPLVCLKSVKVRSIFDVESGLHHKFRGNHIKIRGSSEWFEFSKGQIQSQVIPTFSRLDAASRKGIVSELTQLLNWAIVASVLALGFTIGWKVIDLPQTVKTMPSSGAVNQQ